MQPLLTLLIISAAGCLQFGSGDCEELIQEGPPRPETELPCPWLPTSSSNRNEVGGRKGSRSADSCTCRQRQVKFGNISSGQAGAEVGEIPWRVSLVLEKVREERTNVSSSVCGGTILSRRWVLTAAHCLQSGLLNNNKSGFGGKVHAGEIVDLNAAPIPIDRVILHEGFREKTLDHDIALVHLASDLDFSNPNIQPACLPYGMMRNQMDRVLATGWAPIPENNNLTGAHQLLKVQLDMITNSQCQRLLKKGETDGRTGRDNKIEISNLKVCTYTQGKDTCQATAGGTIDWQNSDGVYYPIGVASQQGFGCAREGKPGVYSRISAYLPWIERSIREGLEH